MEYGRYYEELEVGTVYRHWPGRTVSEYDNTLFALLSMNQNPLFVDEEYARKLPAGRRPVIDTLVFSLTVGMSVRAKRSPTWDTRVSFSSDRCFPAIPCMRNPKFWTSANRPVSPTAALSQSKRARTTRDRKGFWFCAGSIWLPSEVIYECSRVQTQTDRAHSRTCRIPAWH